MEEDMIVVMGDLIGSEEVVVCGKSSSELRKRALEERAEAVPSRTAILLFFLECALQGSSGRAAAGSSRGRKMS